MGYIATPKGIDFTIQSKPLTDKERKEISDFIQKSKKINNALFKPSKGRRWEKRETYESVLAMSEERISKLFEL